MIGLDTLLPPSLHAGTLAASSFGRGVRSVMQRSFKVCRSKVDHSSSATLCRTTCLTQILQSHHNFANAVPACRWFAAPPPPTLAATSYPASFAPLILSVLDSPLLTATLSAMNGQVPSRNRRVPSPAAKMHQSHRCPSRCTSSRADPCGHTQGHIHHQFD